MKLKSRLMCAVLLLVCSALPVLAGGDGHGFDVTLFFQKLVNTLIFFGGLAFILRKPVVDFFSNRRDEIVAAIQKAEQSNVEAAEALEALDKESQSLEAEVKQLLEQAKADAAAEKERLINLANQEAEAIGRQAKLEIENMKRSALSELRVFLTDLAIKEAEKVISETMTDDERKKLFVDFSARLGAKS